MVVHLLHLVLSSSFCCLLSYQVFESASYIDPLPMGNSNSKVVRYYNKLCADLYKKYAR